MRLHVSALEKASFQLFAERVKTHSSSAKLRRQSVPRRRTAHVALNDLQCPKLHRLRISDAFLADIVRHR